jgi:hypothetical protein
MQTRVSKKRRAVARRVVLVASTLVGSALASNVHTSPARAADVPSTDYGAEAWGDPWDYNNTEDQILADDGPMRGAVNSSISGGQLHFDMAGQGYLHPLWGGYPGSLPTGRDGVLHPVDTGRYTQITFRMNASAEVPAGIRWYTCQEISDACQGGFNFFTKPGWNTYSFPLQAIDQPSLTTPWSGRVVSIRMALSPGASQHFDVDWLRLTPTGVPATEDVGPVPVLDEPNATGGADYATINRSGDAWDFDKPSDVLRADNVAGSVSDGKFVGTNAAPALNDPSVTMRLANTFSGDQFHRVTVAYSYDGPFNLEDKPNGGTNARLIWRIAGTKLTTTGADLQNSDDVVTYPNQKSFTIDLASSPASAVTDPDQAGPRVGWAGQMIEMLRFDPNEDRGARSWKIDSIKVADDAAAAKSFDVVWHDAAWQPGTKADIYIDTDGSGFDGAPIASGIDVKDGRNSYTFTPPGPGRWYVYIVHSQGGRSGRSYSTGPVRIGGITDPNGYTFGPAVGGPSSQAGAGATGAPAALPLTAPGGKGRPAVKGAKPPKAPKSAKPGGGSSIKAG